MKILKTILIVIFALVFAVSGGLLVYGALNPSVSQEKEKVTIGGAPDLSLFEGGKSAYDVQTLFKEDGMTSEDATDLMLQTAYNLINIKQFFFNARVDVQSERGWAFSDYHYTQNGLDSFKRAQSYTGDPLGNGYVLRCYYADQKLVMKGTSDYDFDKETWSYTSVLVHEVEKASQGKDEESPYYYYGTLDFPLDFGGQKAKFVKEGRTDAINYALIDTVSIPHKKNETEGYYTLEFTLDITALNLSEESKMRLSGTTADDKMENITFKDFKVTAEIWKDAGVFRTLSYVTNVHASLNGKSGDIKIEKTMQFSYDDENCSIAKKIMTVKDSKGAPTFYNDLSDANKSKCDAENAALKESSTANKDEE